MRQAQASVEVAEAALSRAQIQASHAKSELERARNLLRSGGITQKDLEAAQLADRDAQAQVVLAEAQLAQARAARGSAEASLRQAETLVRQAEGRLKEAQSRPAQIRVREADAENAAAELERARAALQQAELNLSYTKIYAPEAGYITKKSVEPGNIVGAGQALMALVSDRLWVVANFKETQLRRMQPGQRATLRIDAYPQRRFRGRVDSIMSGAGARFSLLPPENATGNYVKVVQRVPVKIVFDEPLPAELKIGPGMSVVPEVRVR